MGQEQSSIPEADLESFANSTFFTKVEINSLYKKFESLGGSLDKPLGIDEVCKLEEIRNNPFNKRICEVFGHATFKTVEVDVSKGEDVVKENKEEKVVMLNFNNFLQMLNAFCPRSSLKLKTFYAFKIFDFDGDRFINTDDILKTMEIIVGENKMSIEKMNAVAAAVLLQSNSTAVASCRADGVSRLGTDT